MRLGRNNLDRSGIATNLFQYDNFSELCHNSHRNYLRFRCVHNLSDWTIGCNGTIAVQKIWRSVDTIVGHDGFRAITETTKIGTPKTVNTNLGILLFALVFSIYNQNVQ